VNDKEAWERADEVTRERDDLRSEVRDLKVRLKEARSMLSYLSNFTALSVAASVLDRTTDLRVKNGRKP